MPSLRLTKTSAERLEYKGKREEYFDTKLTGFGVRVNEKTKSYFAQGKINLPDGTRKKFNESIGRVGIMLFDDAWVEAKRILEDAARGITPRQQREERVQQTKRDAALDLTLRKAYDEYVAVNRKLKESSRKEYRVSMERYIPDWLDLPVRKITSTMVIERHALIGKRSPAKADGVMRVVRALCQFVIDTYEDSDIISRNPVRKLSAAKAWFRPQRKTTYIRAEDLPAWFTAVLDLDDLPRMYLLLLLFSGARFTETAALQVADYNPKACCMVFRDTKSGMRLEVPVSSYLVPRLDAYIYRNSLKGNDFLFPSIGTKRSSTGHIKDMRTQCDKVIQCSGVKFTPHDLRRSFLSYCESLRIPKLIQKRLVGHAIPIDVTDGYIQIPFEDLERAVEDVTVFILKAAKQA
jgi:integrase